MRTRWSLLEADSPTDNIPDETISLDSQVLKAIIDAERAAVTTGKQQQSMSVAEAVRLGRLSFVLREEEAKETKLPPIDVSTLASEISRIIENATTLLDIEGVIGNKAYHYILTKYGKDTADKFRDELDKEMGRASTTSLSEPPAEDYAVGARDSATAGGG